MNAFEASALWMEILTKLHQFEVHLNGNGIVTIVCSWCGLDLMADYDMVRLDDLACAAFTHTCAGGGS